MKYVMKYGFGSGIIRLNKEDAAFDAFVLKMDIAYRDSIDINTITEVVKKVSGGYEGYIEVTYGN